MRTVHSIIRMRRAIRGIRARQAGLPRLSRLCATIQFPESKRSPSDICALILLLLLLLFNEGLAKSREYKKKYSEPSMVICLFAESVRYAITPFEIFTRYHLANYTSYKYVIYTDDGLFTVKELFALNAR